MAKSWDYPTDAPALKANVCTCGAHKDWHDPAVVARHGGPEKVRRWIGFDVCNNFRNSDLPTMNQMQQDVRTFQEICGQRVESLATPPTLVGPKEVLRQMNTAGPILAKDFASDWIAKDSQVELYMNLVNEEHKELADAYAANDVVGIADGVADLIWVALGLCNAVGINIAPVWEEVRASNMSKTVDGKVIKRADGKILKPDTYFPPNIAKALGLET